MATLEELTERIVQLEQRLAAPSHLSPTIGGSLLQIDHLKVLGEQNIIKVYTQKEVVKNGGVNVAGTWEIDYSAQKFSEVYACIPIFQGFAVIGIGENEDFHKPHHATDVRGIPQIVHVQVDHFDKQKASGRTYCSESGEPTGQLLFGKFTEGNGDTEGDNTVLFTLLVLGKG
ncbi:MAG: hypothetical protein ACOYNY_44330 [Caldilineaceae bacterium]